MDARHGIFQRPHSLLLVSREQSESGPPSQGIVLLGSPALDELSYTEGAGRSGMKNHVMVFQYSENSYFSFKLWIRR